MAELARDARVSRARAEPALARIARARNELALDLMSLRAADHRLIEEGLSNLGSWLMVDTASRLRTVRRRLLGREPSV